MAGRALEQEKVVSSIGHGRVVWVILLGAVLCGGGLTYADARIDAVVGERPDAGLPCISRFPTGFALLALPPVPRHAFWDRENLYLFGAVAVMRTLDYTSTLNMLRRGREEILLPDDVVNNDAGFAALEAASTAASIGISYLLHATGHHRLERWVSIGHISVAGFGAARNYALESHHRAK
ncbi:MAG TPA: hypothetical protein VEK84_05415 [Terriglobales bacterium]|nr:hypothetical protein [Terriglobales bacterium]